MTGNEQNPEQTPADETNIDEDLIINADSEIVNDEAEATADMSEEEVMRLELEAAQDKAGQNLELAQRTQAEMENLRKRTTRDIENAHKYALERFVNELLPVIDSLELGIQAAESAGDSGSLLEGMNLTLKKFSDSLEKFGVVVLDPAGNKFNPEQHNAVSMADDSGQPSGEVISVLQKGYELNGRLVRPAMVVVAK